MLVMIIDRVEMVDVQQSVNLNQIHHLTASRPHRSLSVTEVNQTNATNAAGGGCGVGVVVIVVVGFVVP